MTAAEPGRTPAETVRLQYLASAIGDMDLWRSVVAEDVEWTESAGFPLARYSARNKATGKAMQARVAHSFIVRNGRIVRMEQIVDSANVRAAMS